MRTSVIGRYASGQAAVAVLWTSGYRRVPCQSRGGYADPWPEDCRTFESENENIRPLAVRVSMNGGEGCEVAPCEWRAA